MHERGVLAVDLKHILDLYRERTIRSQWRASWVYATGRESGEPVAELMRLADGQTFIAGEHLSRIAHALDQVIDGEFSAFESGGTPWVIIRAVDASLYEVFSTEPAVLDIVRASFRKVSDCDYVA